MLSLFASHKAGVVHWRDSEGLPLIVAGEKYRQGCGSVTKKVQRLRTEQGRHNSSIQNRIEATDISWHYPVLATLLHLDRMGMGPNRGYDCRGTARGRGLCTSLPLYFYLRGPLQERWVSLTLMRFVGHAARSVEYYKVYTAFLL